MSVARLVYRTMLRHARSVARSGRPLALQSEVDATRWGKFQYGGALNPPNARDAFQALAPCPLLLNMPVQWPQDNVLSGKALASLVTQLFRASAAATSASPSTLDAEALLDESFEALRVLGHLMDLHERSSTTVTDGVRIVVTAKFLCLDERGHDVYAYRVRVENQSTRNTKLVGRHWVFVDAFGETIETERFAPGVVGQTPFLRPGNWFEYVSGVNLMKSPGKMHGGMLMTDDGGRQWEALVAPLRLSAVPGSPDAHPAP